MRPFNLLTGCLVASALSACQMLDSERLSTSLSEGGSTATCQSNAGTYFLPRRLITIELTEMTGKAAGFGINIVQDNTDYVADRNESYCLDFLLSYLSADRVGIQRNKQGLLERVYTQAEDKTPKIAKEAIQATADLIASEGARSLSRSLRPQIQIKDKPNVIASFQFDPFVEREAREANNALSEYGFCVFVDARNDPFAPEWSSDICKEIVAGKSASAKTKRGSIDPALISKYGPSYPRSGLKIFDPNPVAPTIQERGILYRPELSHSLVVLQKPDPKSRHTQWRAAGSQRIIMPNAAPAFVLEVKRAAFVKAETDIQLQNGLLKNVSVNKPSELLAVSNVTLAAAQIVVDIPNQALKILNNRVANTEALIKANSDLIDVLRKNNIDANADAQARLGTDLILGRSAAGARSANTPASRLAECLADPATQQYEDPVSTCRQIVGRNL
jgi:hypothetical protein